MKPQRRDFARSLALAGAISAIIANHNLTFIQQQQAIQALPIYVSRGKGGRKSPRTFPGVARARRQAKKLRNKSK